MGDFDPGSYSPHPIEGMSTAPVDPATDNVSATFGQRFGAAFLDGLFVGVLPGVILFIIGAALPKEPAICEKLNGDLYYCETPTGGSWAVLLLLWLTVFAVTVFWYYGTLEGRQGATPGKRIVGIRVVDRDGGGPIGLGRGVGRYFMRIVSGMFLFIGYLWMLWDDNDETWHDKAARSRVVKA